MAELLIVGGPLLALIALALIGNFVPLAWIAGAALALMVSGLLLGLPTGLYYHVLLRRALLRKGPLPKGWYWNPTRYHAELDAPSERAIRPWLVSGALGFGVIMLGLTLAVVALFLWFRAQGGAPA